MAASTLRLAAAWKSRPRAKNVDHDARGNVANALPVAGRRQADRVLGSIDASIAAGASGLRLPEQAVVRDHGDHAALPGRLLNQASPASVGIKVLEPHLTAFNRPAAISR
jgi:hypothetical protein